MPLAPFNPGMSILELSILYLSVASAVGAYGYLSAAGAWPQKSLVALGSAVLWPVYTLFVVRKKFSVYRSRPLFDGIPEPDSFQEKYGPRLRELESLMTSGMSGERLFLFRDTLARYAGLTLSGNSTQIRTEIPLFTMFGGKNNEIQAICFARRNRNTLNRHRINARAEFLNTLRELLPSSRDREKAGEAAIAFAKLLNDGETASMIREHVDRLPQIPRAISVQGMESSTWIQREQQPT